MTRRAQSQDEPEGGRSTLEEQDRALDGPATRVRDAWGEGALAFEPRTAVRSAPEEEDAEAATDRGNLASGVPPARSVAPAASPAATDVASRRPVSTDPAGAGEREALPPAPPVVDVRPPVVERPASEPPGVVEEAPVLEAPPEPERPVLRTVVMERSKVGVPSLSSIAPTAWSAAPRWAKGVFFFGLACFVAAGAVWILRAPRRDATPDPPPVGSTPVVEVATGAASGVVAIPPPLATGPAPSASAGSGLPLLEVRVGEELGQDAAQDARDALAALREGVGSCVRDTIGVLPGTSPPLPSKLQTLGPTGYVSTPADYASPFFMCTRLRIRGPQRFVLQWQIDRPSKEGTGIAWLDDDGDGAADRAFGFRAKLVGQKEVELGEIGPLPASRPIVPR